MGPGLSARAVSGRKLIPSSEGKVLTQRQAEAGSRKWMRVYRADLAHLAAEGIAMYPGASNDDGSVKSLPWGHPLEFPDNISGSQILGLLNCKMGVVTLGLLKGHRVIHQVPWGCTEDLVTTIAVLLWLI